MFDICVQLCEIAEILIKVGKSEWSPCHISKDTYQCANVLLTSKTPNQYNGFCIIEDSTGACEVHRLTSPRIASVKTSRVLGQISCGISLFTYLSKSK